MAAVSQGGDDPGAFVDLGVAGYSGEAGMLADRAADVRDRFRGPERLGGHRRLAERPQHDLRIDVARAIRSLPEHYREVVLLRDIEEMSIDEICGALGLTRESTKARLHRARGMIREYLRD